MPRPHTRLWTHLGQLHAWLWRSPMLLWLLPFAVGIYLQTEGASPYWVLLPLFLVLTLGLCLSMLSSRPKVRMQQALAPNTKTHSAPSAWRSMVFTLSLALCLMAMGMLRRGFATNQSKAYSTHRLSQEKENLNTLLHQEGFSPHTSTLIAALSLGHLPPRIESKALRHSFSQAGVAHLIVVSGYHLALIVGLLAWGLRPIRYLYLRAYYLVLIIAAWGFTILTGSAIPTVRAALMLSLYLWGRMLGRPVHIPNILTCAALVQLAYDPMDLYRWGMWMSYTAVLSIYLFFPIIKKSIGVVKQPMLSYIWNILSLSLAAQVLLAPLLVYLFGAYTWVFVITALPLTTLTSLLIPIGLVSYALVWLGLPTLGLDRLANPLADGCLSLVHWAGSLPGIKLEVTLPLWGLILCWALALGLGFFARRRDPSDGRLQTLNTL